MEYIETLRSINIIPVNENKSIYKLNSSNSILQFRILNIQEPHIPGNNQSQRVQIRKDHITEFIDKGIFIVGYSKKDQVFMVIDSALLLNKKFRTQSSINFPKSLLSITKEFQMILPMNSTGFSHLFILNKNFENYINYCSIKGYTNFTQLESLTNAFYRLEITRIFNENQPNIPHYLSNLNYLRNFSKNKEFIISHLEGTLFAQGIRNKFNLILPSNLFELLSIEHKQLVLSPSYIGKHNFTVIKDLIQSTNATNFFQLGSNTIELKNKLEYYNQQTASFLKLSKDNISTGSDIDNYLGSLLPNYKEKFEVWNSNFQRFAKRILAGKQIRENFFYDTYDQNVIDISSDFTGYQAYLDYHVNSSGHIMDLYNPIFAMYKHANISLFYKHLNRVLIGKNIIYYRGHICKYINSNKYDDIISRKIEDLLTNIDTDIISLPSDLVSKLSNSKLYQYLLSTFYTTNSEDNQTIQFELSYSESFPFEHGGIIFKGRNEKIGLFPLIFYEVIYKISLPIYFISNRHIYFLSNKSSKPVLKSTKL